MSEGSLDQFVDNIIKEANPQADAVKSLIEVKKRTRGQLNTEVELKTELSSDEIKKHSLMALLSHVVEMDDDEFSKSCIIGDLIDVKERKSISKDRKSRKEIVDVARNPDLSLQNDEVKEGWLKRFFSPKRPAPQ
jgi:hypothetical protein